MYDIFEGRDSFICSRHKEQIPLFLEISESAVQMQCQVCIAKNSYKIRRLISIGQIFDQSKKAVITNWPPLEDDTLYDKMEQLFSDQVEELVEATEIKNYFESIKKKIIRKIDDVQNMAIKNAKEGASNNLISVYNQLARKEDIRECILDLETKEQDMKDIISEAFKNKKENTAKLKSAIENFGNRYQFDKDILDSYLSFSLETLSDIEKIVTQQIKKQDQRENYQQQTQNKMVQFMDDLGSTIKNDSQQFANQFSVKSMIAIEDEIKRNLQYSQRDSKSPSLPDFDRISLPSSSTSSLSYKALNQRNLKSNLQQRIAISISKRQCKLSKAIQQNGFSFKNIDQRDTYNIGYIEASIDPIKNEFFSIHVKNLQNWIGIGLVEKEKVNKDGQSKVDSESICGYYMLSHNGYVWQQNKSKSCDKNGQFVFKADDVVTVTIIGGQVIFEKQNYRHRYELQIQLNENTYLYPGFILYSQGDEVEFVHS